MQWIRIARALGGLAAIAVLLYMVLQGWLEGRLVGTGTILLMLGIISALLGVDMVTEKVPLTIKYEDEHDGRDRG